VATANDLIIASYRRGRILGVDQVPSASESADALAALNRMLDAWWNDRLLVYQIVQENFPLVAGQVSRTIGVGGNFNTTRPVKLVDGCFVRQSGVDYQLVVIEDRTQYDAIEVKSTPGRPRYVFYDPSYPLGTLYFYYVPDAADTVFLNSWKRLQSLAALVTAVSLPPGYEELIVDGLAIKLCPDFGLSAPTDVRASFATNKRTLSRVNAPSLVMSVDPMLPGRSGVYDINTG
jgi:hypothetical protein